MGTLRGTGRLLALSACGVLASALAWLPAQSSSAAVSAQFSALGRADTSSACPLTAGVDDPESHGAHLASGKKKRSVKLDATFTNTGDPTDIVRMTGRYTGTLAVTKKAGDLTRARMQGSGNVAIDADLGGRTKCAPAAMVDTHATLQFTEHRRGWLYAERTTGDRWGLSELTVQNTDTSEPVIFDVFQGRESHATSRGFVAPGSYAGLMAVGLAAGDQGITLKASPRSSLNLVFHRSGSALSATAGSGKRYVQLPSSVSCSKHRATLRWKVRAGDVAKGVFYVNGKKQVTDSTPRGGERIVLSHLKRTADVEVTARLGLAAGGKAKATRSYVPCQG